MFVINVILVVLSVAVTAFTVYIPLNAELAPCIRTFVFSATSVITDTRN